PIGETLSMNFRVFSQDFCLKIHDNLDRSVKNETGALQDTTGLPIKSTEDSMFSSSFIDFQLPSW
ncbi:MAG: hypothetical protein HW407_1581, partial [Bacteroidetes bacterium]|nr:hypothetical protein [Bacteroidota bacterium]